MYVRLIPSLALVCLGGCASLPSVGVHYFLPKATIDVKVVQTIVCSDGSGELVFAHSASTHATIAANPARRIPFELRPLDGTWSDTDLAFGFTADGRLATVNATSEGKGGDVIESVIALASRALLSARAAPRAIAPNVRAATASKACDIVRKWGEGKGVSITYAASVPYAGPETSLPALVVDGPSQPLHGALVAANARFPALTMRLQATGGGTAALGGDDAPGIACDPTRWPSASDAFGRLVVNQTSQGSVEFSADDKAFHASTLTLPEDQCYAIPVPRSKAFGSSTFALTLTDAGAIGKIQYAKKTGFGAATQSAASVVGALRGPGDADKAAALKAQADVIQQQERLARCQVNPATCE